MLNPGLSEPVLPEGESSYDTTTNACGESETVHLFVQSTDYEPSYNIPPTSEGVIIYMKEDSGAKYNYVIEPLKFGMLPEWVKPKDPQPVQRKDSTGLEYSREVQQQQAKHFNCRKETISRSQSVWAIPRKNKRCVIPILGYFEWQKTKSEKTPYYVYLKKSPLLYLVGLYSHNTNYNDTKLVPAGQEYISTFSIATGPAQGKGSNDLSWLHLRKPILIKPNTPEWFEWLDPTVTWDEKLLDTCLNCETNPAYDELTSHVVALAVGNPGFKGPEAIKEVNKSQKSIGLFFQTPPKREHKSKPEPKQEKADAEIKAHDDAEKGHTIKKESQLLTSAEKRGHKEAEDDSIAKRIHRSHGSEDYIKKEEPSEEITSDEDEDED